MFRLYWASALAHQLLRELGLLVFEAADKPRLPSFVLSRQLSCPW